MTVELTVIEPAGVTGQYAITGRVQLACEVLAVDGIWTTVRLLEAGAGRAIDDEITVPSAKVSEDWDGSI